MKIPKYFVFPQMKRLTLLILLLFHPLHADVHPSYPPNPRDGQGGKTSPEFSKSNAVAIYWINLIDQKQYSATWLEAGSMLQELITQDQWAYAMAGTRENLGTVNSRKVSAHQSTQSLPGGTRGNFMIITYDTQYAKLPNAQEVITLMTDGHPALWKVIAYKIQARRHR